MTGSVFAAVGPGGIVGFMLGLLGGGGPIPATPLLLYVVGVAQPHVAIGTGALAVSVNAFANFASHAIKGNVCQNMLIRPMCLPLVALAIVPWI